MADDGRVLPRTGTATPRRRGLRLLEAHLASHRVAPAAAANRPWILSLISRGCIDETQDTELGCANPSTSPTTPPPQPIANSVCTAPQAGALEAIVILKLLPPLLSCHVLGVNFVNIRDAKLFTSLNRL